MSEVEGVLAFMLEFFDGLHGWLRPRNRLKAGDMLRVCIPALVSADAGEKGRFLTTVPKGAVLRVARVSGGDRPTCWATPVDDAIRRAIVPKDRRLKIAPNSYQLEIRSDDVREYFERITKP